MHRTFFLALSFCILAGAATGRETAPFRAGGNPPDAKKTPGPAENPQQVIDKLRSDFDRAGRDLDKKDPGLETRKTQQRIIEGIDKLLDQDDPNQSGANSKNDTPKPENQTAVPPAAEKPAPKPIPQPTPAEKSPTNPAPKPKSATDFAKSAGQTDSGPSTLAELQKKQGEDGSWGKYPPRLRQEMDAFARERFIRNYSEILREYYRALAESNRRDARD